MDKEIDISIQIKVKDMFYFLMRHNYSGFSGIFGLIISVGALILFFVGVGGVDNLKNGVLLVIAALFLIINPFLLYVKAAGQVKRNPMFRKSLRYHFDQQGIIVSQDEQELPLLWEDLKKVVETGGHLILYITAIHAYILPKEQFAQEYPDIRGMFLEYADGKVCRWKK